MWTATTFHTLNKKCSRMRTIPQAPKKKQCLVIATSKGQKMLIDLANKNVQQSGVTFFKKFKTHYSLKNEVGSYKTL